ncbi:MAG: SusC/RagA family TonB-linked outer membrane protein [Segetibacter sp.]|nr:SusC/RagA family TonB-linked outer membrane protein [Segetibacter sp.]
MFYLIQNIDMRLRHLSTIIILTAFTLFLSTLTYAQTRTINGTVTDTAGTGVPGITVSARGASAVTATGTNGTFSITLPTAATALIFTGVGFQQQEVTLGDQTTLTVTLRSVAANLSEVVVIGYGTQRRRELTGSIATVTSRDFQQGAITSPEQLIAGKVAGVTITSNSGAPGAGSTIRVRGLASLNASNDPLIIVDGVPLSGYNISGAANPLSLINPNDIESFNILKDPSATAIYGSRASNGVVIITTKKGRAGKPVISFNTRFSVAQVYRNVDVLTPQQLRSFVDTSGNAQQKALLGAANTDWQKEIYQPALTTDNNLGISGSVNRIPYRVSVGYLNQQGVLKTDNLQRFSGSINVSPRLFTDHLRIDLNLKGSVAKTRFANQGAIGAAVAFDPTQPVHANNPFGGYFEWATIAQGNVVLNPNAPRNPVALLEQRFDRSTVDRSFGNVAFDYRFHFLPDLHANLNLGYDIASSRGTIFVPEMAAQSYATGGTNNRYQQSTNNKVAEFYFAYTKTIAALKSNVSATAGYGYYDNQTKNFAFPSFSARGDTIPGSVPVFGFDIPRNTLISYFGRLIYTLNAKYILALSLRTDGSSRFAPESRWGVFPSVGFTWRVKDEAFLKNSTALSDLKLRLSYGVTGNQEIPYNYSYLPTYSLSESASLYQFGNTFYNMYTPAAYISNIRWEQTAATNVGIDYGFANNRITGSIEYYSKNTTNLLGPVNIPVGSNFTNLVTTNVGSLTNKGFEFSINASPVKNNRSSWDISLNYTRNTTRITELTLTGSSDSNFVGIPVGSISGATGQNIQIHTVGYYPFSFFVYKQLYDKGGRPIEGSYEDLNGDGIINPNDQYRYRTSLPGHVFGLNTSYTYGKWGVNTVVRANLGNYVYNNISANLGVQRNVLSPSGHLGNATTDILNTNFYNNQYRSDYYIQNAAFARMDNVGVSYNVGRVLNNKANLRLNANCQNVFVITKYKGTDPEIYSGIDNNFYPRPRVYTLSLNLDF